MKTLDYRQRAFKAEEITYLDRKAIQLDRMLLKLFELLRYDGYQVIRQPGRALTIQRLTEYMSQNPDRFPGFGARPDVAKMWLSGDLFEIMNRGKGEGEMLVGPRPYHLSALKLVNPGAVADYGASMQVWALLYYADRPLLTLLKDFFGRGLDNATDEYDMATPLDLETLAILGLADKVKVNHSSTPPPAPIRPLCLGQGRLMADDLRRLLAYEGKVPRHVLTGYLRTALGLHLALYQLRLFQLVPSLVAQAQRGIAIAECPGEAEGTHQRRACAYRAEMVIDLTDNPSSPTVQLARASAQAHIDGIARYVRAVILLNRLKDYATVPGRTLGARPKTVEALLALLRESPSDMEGFFAARIADIITTDEEDQQESQQILDLLQISSLSSFEKYVELVCHDRLKNERTRLITLLDSLAQKNKPGGFLKQTAGARSPRWFGLGADLLEMLVQIAALERDTQGAFRSRSLLIDDFIEWLRTRYGFVIYAPAHREVPPEEQEAWRANERALRTRLRQIGFFSDLSDAYNSQTLRPRYMVRSHD